MVERWSPKPNAVGSNPTTPAKKGRVILDLFSYGNVFNLFTQSVYEGSE